MPRTRISSLLYISSTQGSLDDTPQSSCITWNFILLLVSLCVFLSESLPSFLHKGFVFILPGQHVSSSNSLLASPTDYQLFPNQCSFSSKQFILSCQLSTVNISLFRIASFVQLLLNISLSFLVPFLFNYFSKFRHAYFCLKTSF